MLKKSYIECPRTNEIVSYMYGEIGGPSALEFESHLADCMACTDEFAAVSVARFSVFEWQKEEFSHLPTPEIVIPYATPADAAATVPVITAVRAWLGSLSFPIAVAAMIVVCVSLGVVVFNIVGRREQQVAGNIAAPAIPQNVALPQVAADPNPIPVEGEKRSIRTPVPVKASADQPRRPVRRSSPAGDHPANNYAVAPNKTAPAAKTPALSVYDDNDDNSLRLADLFDEVGG